jgi:hypothetical protein
MSLVLDWWDGGGILLRTWKAAGTRLYFVYCERETQKTQQVYHTSDTKRHKPRQLVRVRRDKTIKVVSTSATMQ